MEFTQAALAALLRENSPTCISLFMTMDVAGRERAGNRLRFKNLIRDAERLLRSISDDEQVNDLLKPLHELYHNEEGETWRHPQPGLAVFRSPDRFEVYTLRNAMNEEVHVGNRYYLRPMLGVLQGDGGFLLLAASQNRVRLFEGDRETMIECRLSTLPTNLVDALNVDEWTSTLQYHSHSRGGHSEAMFHGQGGGDDDHKSELLRFFQRLNDGLTAFLTERGKPLLFAGVGYLFPIFREACNYRHLIEPPLTGNPDEMSAEQLHDQAWALVAPRLQKDLHAVIEKFGNVRATGLGTTQLQEILTAAQSGAVEAMLIQAGESRWGEIDTDGIIRNHDSHHENSIDLVDEAAFLTLRTGGRVWLVESDEFPADADATAAILRFPGPFVQSNG